MSGYLSHTPAKVIRQLLINEALVLGANGTADWTSYTQNEPDLPANSVTLYNTPARRGGRLMPTGQTQVHYGIQTRVRAEGPDEGFNKASAIYDFYDTVLRNLVILDTSSYIVQAITNIGSVLPIGYDRNTTRRIYVVNSVVDLWLDTQLIGDFFGPDFEDQDFNE